jgi:L-ascorbate metabolism protein UlaG (beta-lactamase superfamily)
VVKITKLGHCCLVLEVAGLKVITDPGMYTVEAHTKKLSVDIVLITHEHPDHLHIESLKIILEKNPDAVVVSNDSVAKILHEQGIEATHISGGESAEIRGLRIEGFGHEHQTIFESFGKVENTGYFVGEKFYFPGDSFFNPKKPVDILALPVAGPWMKISDAIKFVNEVKPRVAFGVHDGILTPSFRGFPVAVMEFGAPGVKYISLMDGAFHEF